MKLFLFSFLILTCSMAISQEGNYTGDINVNGNKLEIDFKINKKSDQLSGKLNIPIQGAKGLELIDFKTVNDSLKFTLDGVPGGAYAVVKVRDSSLLGSFYQGGMVFPFTAHKIFKEEVIDLSASLLYIDSLRQWLHVQGVSVGVIHKGKVIMNQGFGYRDLDNKLPADENTVYAIGSTSKAFTSALVAKCVEEDLIDWKEPIRYHVPEFGMKDAFANEMNAEDLLTHRSGLPRHDLLWYGTDFTRQELISKIKYLEPTENFRTRFQYQNLMYMTAGQLAANLKESTWEDLVKTEIFDPLGMSSSSTSLEGMTKHPNASAPFIYHKGKVMQMDYRNLDAIGPAGSINSTTTDMLKWTQMLLNNGSYGDNKEDKILNQRSVRKIMSPHIMMSTRIRDKKFTELSYGLAWMINRYQGHKVVQHGGNIDGFSALVYLMPEDDLGIVVLTNDNGSKLNDLISLHLTDKILGFEENDWYKTFFPKGFDANKEEEEMEAEKSKKDVQGPYFELKDYAGIYKNKIFGTVDIKFDDGQLKTTMNGTAYTLTYQDKEIFAVKEQVYGSETSWIFRHNLSGELDYLEIQLEQSLPPYKFKKEASDELKDLKYLAEFVGQYELTDMTISITIEDDKLVADVAGQPTMTLVPASKDKFALGELAGFMIEFTRTKKGKVDGLISHQPNGDFEAEKVD